jgi:hypothetical protein
MNELGFSFLMEILTQNSNSMEVVESLVKSSSKITMKLNFQPFRIKIHYGLIQNQLDIFGLVKNL